jgi:hypothetical protein
VDISVGEAELWGARSWLDVPQIHAIQFGQLRLAVDIVRAARRTQVRFVRGVGGSGKSHLFARLRRDLPDSIFYAYAANPPLQAEALESFLLSKLVGSLRHRARGADGSESPYSQLRLLSYALLMPVLEQELTIDELHQSWACIDLDTQKALLHDAMLLLEADHPMVPRGVIRSFLNILREDKEHLAGQWLAGTTYLTEADLKYLGEAEPLGRDQHSTVIHLLGKLAAMANRPFVLVLDQLDLVSSAAHLDEFQRLLFALIDQSENWVVFIGLVGDRFRFWEENINQALRGRIGQPDPEKSEIFRLPIIDVTPILAADKLVLLQRRLASPALQRHRAKQSQPSTLHPLSEDDMRVLTTGGAVYARHLLAAGSERFAKAVMEPGLTNRVALADKVEALLEEGADAARGESVFLTAVELSERARELVELLSPTAVAVEVGPMRTSYRGFDGADHRFDSGGRSARLVASDATRRAFISVLERLQEDNGHTLLVRNAAAGISGQLTMDLFNQFKQRNFFHHVAAAEAAVLIALGSILASLREGNYDQLLTEPPATRDNMIKTLKESGRLRALPVWLALQNAFAGKGENAFPPARPFTRGLGPAATNGKLTALVPTVPSRTATLSGLVPTVSSGEQAVLSALAAVAAGIPTLASPQQTAPAALPSAIEIAVRAILLNERWIDMRRLQSRLLDAGCGCEIEVLRRTLKETPLAQCVMMHPREPGDDGDGIQIVLWNENVR